MPEINPSTETKDPLILRCIKALGGVDWKAMMIVIAALAGFGGAIWNKVDSIVEKALMARTQQGVYDLLAQRMDNVDQRLIAVEEALTGKSANHEQGARPAPQNTTLAVVPDRDGAGMAVKAIPFPTFEQIQQSAKVDRMPELLDAVSAQ